MLTNEQAKPSQAPGLVILPGLLCDGRMFEAQVAAFGATVIDGFYGGADRIETMADHALSRMPARSCLLGHSMGARVALEIVRRAPARVERLALADTGVHPVGEHEPDKRKALLELGRREGAGAMVDAWLPPMVASAARSDVELMAGLRAMAVDAGVETFSRQIEALLKRPDPRPTLAMITVPTLVIVGEDDEWSPPSQHREIAAMIAGACLTVIPTAGHMAPAEAPTAFNEAIRNWLN